MLEGCVVSYTHIGDIESGADMVLDLQSAPVSVLTIGPESSLGYFTLSFGVEPNRKVFKIHRPTGRWEEIQVER